MKTKLLVLMMDSFDKRYISESVTPNFCKIGDTYSVPLPFGVPGITAKSTVWFYTGEEWKGEVTNWQQYFYKMKDSKCFWDDIPQKMAILSFPLGGHLPTPNVKYFVSVTREYRNVYPKELEKNFGNEITELAKILSRNLNKVEIAIDVNTKYHELYKKILEEYKDEEVDCLILYYNMDWFTHTMKGPELLKKYTWIDSLMGEILNYVEYDNIVAFSEHGADHFKECVMTSSYGYEPKTYGDIVDFIISKVKEL